MIHTIRKFKQACRVLVRAGFSETTQQWSDIDKEKFEAARVLYPDGSYLLYVKERQLKDQAHDK